MPLPAESKLVTEDTIVALATAPGRGSVGIIRLSGPNVPALAQQLTNRQLKPRHAHYGPFLDPNNQHIIDEGLAIYFGGPKSFTGEDVLELQGHGGPVVMDLLLQAVLNTGKARMARPGEFSERAFLNGKFDLTQAEAIADLIDASSQQAARNAIHSLQGAFSQKIHSLVEELTRLRIYVEAAIDFPEEEIDFLQDRQLIDGMQTLKDTMAKVKQQAKQGSILREGMNLVIAGKPNAGKSSLLNALAGRDTAIVTDIPGTTRDILREHIHLDDMPLHIVDTAGLRKGGDEVERLGMQRAWTEITKADRILLLIDASQYQSWQPTLVFSDFLPDFGRDSDSDELDHSRITLVFTKLDLCPDNLQLPRLNDIPQISISAKTGAGLDELSQHLKETMGYKQVNEGSFTARRRHLEALEKASDWLNNANQQLQNGSGELAAEDLRQAQNTLATITGKVSADELLGKIFSSFCIGK